jgi:site-specific recombinase XerD
MVIQMAKQKIDRTLPDFQEEFLKYLEKAIDCSINTIKSYRSDLFAFCEWLKQYKETDIITLNMFTKMSIKDVTEWRYTLDAEATTVSRKISSLKSLFNYLNNDVKLISNNPTKNIKFPNIPKKKRKFLSLESASELIEMVETEGNERDIAIIKLFLNSGARAEDISNLDLEDIKGDRVLFRHGKGDKERVVYIDNDTAKAINNWLLVRPQTSDKALFILNYFLDKEPYRITYTSIKNLIKKYKEVLGFDGITPHKLRHTYATLQLEAGTSITNIQQALGHEHVETTMIYTHSTENGLKAMAGKVKYKTKSSR